MLEVITGAIDRASVGTSMCMMADLWGTQEGGIISRFITGRDVGRRKGSLFSCTVCLRFCSISIVFLHLIENDFVFCFIYYDVIIDVYVYFIVCLLFIYIH